MDQSTQQTDFVNLHLDVFEGPLDLLLYLIKKNDLDISRVSISKVADQYLEYINTISILNIDMIGDFLIMASELAHIKSKSLLPQNENQESEEEEESIDLISRLREYEKYKLAAQDLAHRPWLGRDVFLRGQLSNGEPIEPTENRRTSDFYELDTFDLIRAFAEILNKLPEKERQHQVIAEKISVSERIYEILDVLSAQESILFTDLFTGPMTKMHIVVNLLAILEMGRMGMIRIYQTGIFESIRLQKKIDIANAKESMSFSIDDFK